MSAFVVSKRHIDVVVSGGLGLLPSLTGIYGTRDLIGQCLWRANVGSVASGYPDQYGPEEIAKYLAEVEGYRHAEVWGVTDGQLAKAVACLTHQSCEAEGWDSSGAYFVLEAIRSAILEALPGYEQAPWGIEESDIVAGRVRGR